MFYSCLFEVVKGLDPMILHHLIDLISPYVEGEKKKSKDHLSRVEILITYLNDLFALKKFT